VTSFCPDALQAEALLLDSRARLRVFYDLDTPITLDRLARDQPVAYIGTRGLADYDLVISYTGGAALDEVRDRLGAPAVLPLYGSVDPHVHQPVTPMDQYRADLSYLGTYSADRQDGVDRLFLEPARRLPARRFVLGGSQYPMNFAWTPNIFYMRHVTPDQHPGFYCSSRLTLNVTRRAMAQTGYCPSGRLFEAAACGVPILSDSWPGLEEFFEPGRELLVASSTDEAVAALQSSDPELRAIGRRARERTLGEHTADHRALELERMLESAFTRRSAEGVGNRSSRRSGDSNSTAGVFEGTAPGR